MGAAVLPVDEHERGGRSGDENGNDPGATDPIGAMLRPPAPAPSVSVTAIAAAREAVHGKPDGDRGARRWIGSHWRLSSILIAGLLARAVLVPITHGPDFMVWDLASRATLRGANIYAHHPAYLGGPYSYFPLFLYLELPMQWLAQLTGASFTILGKLPILAADVLAAAVLAAETRRHGRGDATQALAAGLFFLNPLVLYNGAFYGRFDTISIALLLVAVRLHHHRRVASWRGAIAYGLSVAAKTFPIFILPWFLHRHRGTAARILIACAVVVVGLSAPYVLTSPVAFISDLLYTTDKLSGGLSWQVILHGLPVATQLLIGDVLLIIFVLAAIALSRVDDLVIYSAVVPLLFVVLSKYVIEQYLTWPIAFLALLTVEARSRSAALMLATVTAVGMVVNPYIHPFGEQPAILNAGLSGAILVFVARLLAVRSRRDPSPARVAQVTLLPITDDGPHHVR